MNIYEIDKAIMDCIDEETGEVLDEEKLTALSMERDMKIENVCLWIKDLKAEADALKAEKDALAARQKAKEEKIESLKTWLQKTLAGQKFETARCQVGFRKSKKVVVDDIWSVPDEYMKYSDPVPDKVAIKKAIADGMEIAGAHIEEAESMTVK